MKKKRRGVSVQSDVRPAIRNSMGVKATSPNYKSVFSYVTRKSICNGRAFVLLVTIFLLYQYSMTFCRFLNALNFCL